MHAERIGVSGLSGSVIERYLEQRRAAGYVEYRSMRALRPLLDYLAEPVDGGGGDPPDP